MSEERSIWDRFRSLFGARDRNGEKEAPETASQQAGPLSANVPQQDDRARDDDRSRITKEKIAELSGVIDGQVEALCTLEQNWHAVYERVEGYVKERDEQDAAFAKSLSDLSQELAILGQSLPAESEAAANQKKILSTLYEESRFYAGMTDSLRELMDAHRTALAGLFEQVQASQKALGGISGVTLQAAMLSARFGEEAGEFAAVCDRIREQAAAAASGLGGMQTAIEGELQAYEDTALQLASLTEQMRKNRDAVTMLYEGSRQINRLVASRPENVVQRMTEVTEAMRERLSDAGEASRGIEEATQGFCAIDEQEAQSREQIEAVVQEIQKMITEA